MGRGMAANLVNKGHSVLVYDVAPGAVNDLGKDLLVLRERRKLLGNNHNKMISSRKITIQTTLPTFVLH